MGQFFPEAHHRGLFMYLNDENGTHIQEYTGPRVVANVTSAINEFFNAGLKSATEL